ncbi:MAG: ATPase, T2SS/T4P/T4SS family [Elusimicrobia bacterium]|nr:ATPase, T2SS/T4P/T4SS family [Elusimicrobiota bacterium]
MSGEERERGLLAAFADPEVVELLINDDGSVLLEKAGGAGLLLQNYRAGAADIEAFLKAILGRGEAFGPARPYADLSALDGSRVHVIAPPLVRGGLCVSIRKRPARRPGLEDLVRGGSLSLGCAAFLQFAVAHSRNILVIGGTSSGKTTLLNALAALIPAAQRVIVLEDTPELALPQPHVMYLRTRLRDAGGLADVTLRELVVNTLRMRPDRIIVGEVRGVEAFDMLQAMNVGHDGVMCTLHANSAREGLQRLETLVLSRGLDLPLRAARSNISMAVDLVVSMSRLADGSRRVIQVTELTGMETDTITLSDLFLAESRKTARGMGFALRPTGAMPRFYDQLRRQGLKTPVEFFQDTRPDL